MSTRTPNFNLYEPDPTDNFEDFRAEHNNNMEIIDQYLGGGGSRHTIVDDSGTDMPNETRLQFGEYMNVTDDNVNGKTIVDTKPTEVEWPVWQTMTDAQKAGKHWIISNAPDAVANASQVGYDNSNSGLSSVYVQGAIDELANMFIILRNQTLNFSGNTAIISNANMTADTLFFVFYHDTVEAGNCGITADGSLNTITFTIGDTPSNPIVCDILIKK